MSIATELSRVQTDRNTIRTKLVELGLAASTANLDVLAAAIEDIVNQGAISAEVKEGETYVIPKGYHPGTGTVKGVSGGGNYILQAKAVTPTKKQQAVAPDAGYYGLSSVTVGAIPENFQDVSSVTATAADTLTGKIFVAADGTVTTGTMPNNGATDAILSGTLVTYVIPKGYHNGAGTVKIVLETKSVVPAKSAIEVTPTTGRVLSKVTVEAIPDKYQDVTGVTTIASHVLDGDYFVDAEGDRIEGTMPDNGATAKTIDGLTVTSVSIPEGYTSGGTVSLTDDIEDALAAI